MPIRRSDVIERIGERALSCFVLGGVSLILGLLLYYYTRFPYGEYVTGLAWVLMIGGVGLLIVTSYSFFQPRRVSGFDVQCPYCSAVNVLTAPPDEDFRCTTCQRVVPVQDNQVLPVFQVRCGYCNELNFYSTKNEVLICEKCDHEIPLTTEEGKPVRHVPKAYAVQDDERLYELVLVGFTHRSEELITSLQHMLALNRNQVKDLLNEVPATLLTGITRKKAELLQAQLAIHDAAAEYRPLG